MPGKANWSCRCASCGNPRHYLRYYIRGWLVWHLIVRWWPTRWGLPPLLSLVGDYAYDHRQCQHVCGPHTFKDTPDHA